MYRIYSEKLWKGFEIPIEANPQRLIPSRQSISMVSGTKNLFKAAQGSKLDRRTVPPTRGIYLENSWKDPLYTNEKGTSEKGSPLSRVNALHHRAGTSTHARRIISRPKGKLSTYYRRYIHRVYLRRRKKGKEIY